MTRTSTTRPAPRPPTAASADDRPSCYVRAPRPLLAQLAHDPAAVGIWLVVARLALARRGPVPLSRADLGAFFGIALSGGAIKRRIDLLTDNGWLIARQPARGAKQELVPAWGHGDGGADRPWDWQRHDHNKPEHLRCVRVATDLIDHLIGRLDPKAGRTPAVITRYFTVPLLSPADLGAYALAWHVTTTAPTPSLQALGLLTCAGDTPRAPRPLADLLQIAASGRLHLSGDAPIRPSVHGWDRIGVTPPPDAPQAGALFFAEGSGSISGSISGSKTAQQLIASEGDPEGRSDAPECAPQPPVITQVKIAWDLMEYMENQPTKHDPPPPVRCSANGGGGMALPLDQGQGDDRRSAPEQPGFAELAFGQLDPDLRSGHLALNPSRAIPAGEWAELLALESEIGARQLLVWQAKALRGVERRPQGVHPGYYRACAERAALDAYRPPRHRTPLVRQDDAPPPAPEAAPVASPAPVPAPEALTPEAEALLVQMGVRERSGLAGVDVGLMRAWQAVVGHPGLAARFDDPVAFAVTQLRRGNAPPAVAELERWHRRQQRRDDPHETWRLIQAEAATAEAVADTDALAERALALAPDGDDQLALASLMESLAQGLSGEAALARLEAEQEERRRRDAARREAREARLRELCGA
ncbi:MAG: hypothetical protein RLZZ387_1247 [Chloroflexota bacterium]